MTVESKAPEPLAAGPQPITLTVNGREYTASAEPRKTLLDFLRDDLRLTGTHMGCEHGVCGACTVAVDGRAVRSCLLFAVQARGADITTIDGLAEGDQLHPIQQAFREEHGLQCGYCTGGFIMSLKELLERNPNPTEDELYETLGGNICRCTGYQQILASAKRAAVLMKEAPNGR